MEALKSIIFRGKTYRVLKRFDNPPEGEYPYYVYGLRKSAYGLNELPTKGLFIAVSLRGKRTPFGARVFHLTQDGNMRFSGSEILT